MTPEELESQMENVLRDLTREFGELGGPDRVASLVGEHYKRLARQSTVNDFLPLLVYRFTKEDLVESSRDELHRAA